jgi:predicted ATP-grasp superfamily ATP-dependent carboligase
MATALDLPAHLLDRVPAVLLGGVNLVRALGLAAIPVIVASADEDEPAFASRYCAAKCVLPPLAHPEAAVDAIVTIGDRLSTMYGRRVPLFYGSDDYLKLLYANRQRLERYFLLMLNEPGVGAALLTKDDFEAFARKRGLPVPRGIDWDGKGSQSVANYAGPVVVKPSNKDGWTDSPLRKQAFGRAKALVFASGTDAAADPVLALFRDQLTCQPYVAGDDTCNWSYHGFADEKSHVLDWFVGRKLRTNPPDNGESAYIELAENEELRALGEDLAARMQLKGIFKMDFKRDAGTGEWFLLEVNARFNLWHYVGAANGVNLMRTTYDFLLDGTRPAASAVRRADIRWLSLQLDWRAFMALRAEGRLGVVRWLASILSARKVYNVFSWTDPGPWLSMWRRRFSKIGSRPAEKVLAFVRQWRSTAS